MPTITVPEDTYQRLARRAAALGTTVEALALPVLERVSHDPVASSAPRTPPGELPYEEWKQQFDALLVQAKNRVDRYPPGFQADLSRESIYEGCGE